MAADEPHPTELDVDQVLKYIIEPTACSAPPPRSVVYSRCQVLIDNLPYAALVLLGAAIFAAGISSASWRWIVAALFVLYGVGGAAWIMVFVCPYCHFHGTRGCPCGYGQIAARIRPKRDAALFPRKFRRHIPVLIPLFMLPALAGIVFLARGFTAGMLALTVVYAADAFVLLPLVSRKYGCAHCPQKDACPWMRCKR